MSLVIRKLQVSREHRFIHQWQAVKVNVELVDSNLMGSDIGTTWFVPANGVLPLIKIYDPNGIELFDYISMILVSNGHYQFTYQTTDADPLGVYTATVIAVQENIALPNNSEYAMLNKIPVFKIIKEATIPLNYEATPSDPNILLIALIAYYAFEDAVGSNDLVAYYAFEGVLV